MMDFFLVCFSFLLRFFYLSNAPFDITNFIIYFRRRESTDVEDLFIAHITGMDALARGLRNAAKLIEVIHFYYIHKIKKPVRFSKMICLFCNQWPVNETELILLSLKRMVLWLSLSASDIRALTWKLGLK